MPLTTDDITLIRTSGFTIQPDNDVALITLVNTYFPGFNLHGYITDVNNILSPLSDTPIEKWLEFTADHQYIFVSWDNDFGGNNQLVCQRKFFVENGQLLIDHHYFFIPEAQQGNSFGKRVLKASLQHYLKMNADKILIHAALDGGGYAWAKYGFTAIYKKEIDVILNSAASILSPFEFGLVKTIYDEYYSKHLTGNAFFIRRWALLPFMKSILRGSDWHGALNLKNSTDLANFEKYANQ